MSEEQQKPTESNKYLESVEDIQDNAFDSSLENCISVELTYQQALSIHLRSRQLMKEGTLHPNRLSPKIMNSQVDRCYKQQYRKARN